MKSLSTILFVGYLLQFSTAIPAPAPAPADDAHVAEIQKFRNRFRCVLYQPTTPQLTQQTLADCNDVCGEAVAKKKAEDKTSAITCVQDTPIKWEDYPGGQLKVSGGRCSCNSEFIIEFADGFVQALPAIAEIGCNIMMTTLNLVMNIGAALIPGVGQAIDGTLIAGIEVAKLSAYAYDAGQAGLDAFTQWASPCGTSHLPADMKKVFDILNSVDALVLPKGFKPPPKVPKGQPKAPPKTDPPPPKNDPPPPKKDPPPPKVSNQPPKEEPKPTKTNEPPNTTNPPKSGNSSPSPTKACTRKKPAVRRAPPKAPAAPPVAPAAGGPSNNPGSGSECDDDEDKPEIGPEHVTIIAESEAVEKVVTKTCSGALYPQACYNYHSIIESGFLTKAPLKYLKNQFTCKDSQQQKRKGGIATKVWSDEHPKNKWRAYTMDFEWYKDPGVFIAPRCERDEYPPAYFTTIQKEPQRMRWIPGRENGGAGQLWNGFCASNDGGKGNGQLKKDGSVNKDLVSLEKILKKVTTKGKNGKSTTTTSYKAKYTRAIFEMGFDKKWPLDPPEKNNWGLEINPCWPKDITPDDPGYVLLNEDVWYSTKASNAAKAMRANYVRAPTAQEISNAEARKLARHPPPESDSSSSKGDGEDEDESDPDAPGPAKRWIQVLPDGFATVLNDTSQRLTHDGIKRDIRSIRCREPSCLQERRVYQGQPGVLVVPGSRIVGPATNFDAVPTISPSTTFSRKESGSGTASRVMILPGLPMVTAGLS